MTELKPPMDFDEQVEILMRHGMVVNDKEQAAEILRHINYYRFSGYALEFRRDVNSSNYIEKTTFEEVYAIYKVDQQLRDLLRLYIEKVEIYYRTQIAYGFTSSICQTAPYDQHYDEQNYSSVEKFNKVKDAVRDQKRYYKDSLVIKHHREKYGDKLPLWVLVEMMSFSCLSKLYCCMRNTEKNLIANMNGVNANTLKNHLHALSTLRNKCAHAGRLYNVELKPPVKLSQQFLKKNPEVSNSSLFAYLLVLIKRLPDRIDKKDLKDQVVGLIELNNEKLDISLMGFPSNYKDLLNNQVI